MSIPNEALQRLAQEIESQAVTAQRDINVVKSTISAKQREIRMLELTAKELSALAEDTRVYEGVGKMFVLSPTSDVDQRITGETKILKSDIASLNKKLHYLETTYKNSREHIEQIFKSSGRS